MKRKNSNLNAVKLTNCSYSAECSPFLIVSQILHKRIDTLQYLLFKGINPPIKRIGNVMVDGLITIQYCPARWVSKGPYTKVSGQFFYKNKCNLN